MKYLLLLIILIFQLSCKQKPLNFNQESKFLYLLPMNADIYFKFDISQLKSKKSLMNLHRIKELRAYFTKYYIELFEDVNVIYGAVFINDTRKNTFILRGNFKDNLLSKKYIKSHNRVYDNEHIIYSPKDNNYYSIVCKKGDYILLTYDPNVILTVYKNEAVFHAINILKKVEISANGWLLVNITNSVKNEFNSHIELKLLSTADFYSVSYKSLPNENSLSIMIQFYSKTSYLINEIIHTIFNFYQKMYNSYPLINKSFSDFKIFTSNNMGKINLNINLNNIVIDNIIK